MSRTGTGVVAHAGRGFTQCQAGREGPRILMLCALVSLALLSPAVAGCVATPTSPSQYAPFSQTDLRVGAGDAAVGLQRLTVRYTGWLYDASAPDAKGAMFDMSTPGSPLSFVLGLGEVIEGWDQGLVGMRVGGLRRLVVPPSLGYGTTRQGLIPANATLVFEVELLRIGADETPADETP